MFALATGLVALIVVIVLVLGIGLWLAAQYNGLVGLRNKVEAAWAQIDVQLHRRHDLIPNLVETVKGYAAHESETLDAVIRARNAAVAAPDPQAKGAAEGAMATALRSVFALAEAYPDLKANENFAQLQGELSETEDRIAFARQYYNDVVRTHNTKIETVPTVFIARAMKFETRQYFQADEQARGSVQVEFGS